ncbi:MAG: hypothetical protein CR979_03320, partial [Propionibacterium sp.]
MSLCPSELDDPDAIRDAANDLVKVFELVTQTAADIKSTWSGLPAVYTAPEAGVVYQAMVKPVRYGDMLLVEGQRMYNAMLGYAQDLEALKKVREQLIIDIAHEEALQENTWGAVEDAVEAAQGELLLLRVEQFETDLEAAQRRCANQLSNSWGGPTYL